MVRDIFFKSFSITIGLLFLLALNTAGFADGKWSSQDPLSIPLKIRKQQFDKGNLVPNFSFEQGTVRSADSLISDFSLASWSVKGKNVQWTDKNHKGYTGADIATGRHAIKIIRKKPNETDRTGEGVKSDFIPVIPGNYLFTYDVKLKNVQSNKRRLGTKLFDAVDIRLLFFDENKKPIDGKIYYPYKEYYIDNSFKGYSFANFWKIDDFGWAEVRARTYNYPFSEGDLPDNCRYVRLFLGLKGEGEMWVDNVVFKYSRWNFTTMERLQPFFDGDFSAVELLIPTPKQVSGATPIPLTFTGENKPVILMPQNAGPATRYAASVLQDKIAAVYRQKISILTTLPQNSARSRRFVFSIGRTSVLPVNKNKLPFGEIAGKEQGYFIKRLPDRKNIIFLVGNEDIGNFYAATTAAQLFDSRKPVYHHADIVDYPDFLGRSFKLGGMKSQAAIERDLTGIDRMARFKLNKVFNNYGDWGKDWRHPTQIYLDGLKAVGEKCKETGAVNLAVQVHPYNHFKYEMYVPDISDSLKHYWLHSNPDDMEALKNIIRTCFNYGAKTLMLMADDFVPHEENYRKLYSLWAKEDKERFVNLQNAQAYMINEIYRMLKKEYPGSRYEFCPPWYLNEFIDRSRGYAEQYFRDLMPQIPADVAVIWTGNTVRSLSYDFADIERYRKLIGRYPMLWDNTLYARRLTGLYGGYAAYYPGKVRMCNIFEPYDIYLPKDFYKYNDGREIYQNGGTYLEYQKIKYITVADYEWNNNSYHADFSLWKALVTQFGKKNAVNLLKFNDNYYGLVDMTMRIEREDAQQKYVAKAKQFTAAAQKNLAALTKELSGNETLVAELHGLLKGQMKKYEKVLQGNTAK